MAVDGLGLGGSLSEISGTPVLFLPAYRAAVQRLEISRTKVFPEPIDGERLLEAIEKAETVEEGAPDLFHVLDVLQMCCLSKRSGAVQIVKESQTGIVYLRDGKIVHAEGAVTRGTEALLEIAGWGEIEFAYDSSIRAAETISMPWDEALVQAVTQHQKTRRGRGDTASSKPARRNGRAAQEARFLQGCVGVDRSSCPASHGTAATEEAETCDGVDDRGKHDRHSAPKTKAKRYQPHHLLVH